MIIIIIMLMKLKVMKIIRIVKTAIVIVIVMMTIFISEDSVLVNNTLKSPGYPSNYPPNITFHSDSSIQNRSFLLSSSILQVGTVKILGIFHGKPQPNTITFLALCGSKHGKLYRLNYE